MHDSDIKQYEIDTLKLTEIKQVTKMIINNKEKIHEYTIIKESIKAIANNVQENISKIDDTLKTVEKNYNYNYNHLK
ncbi:hypothetical protein A3Q56_08119 [Intoshia linei]|uniref:Uncharacterized protein n=1 Tax=Intoshia linei TaxID=1819745 RepID=A0A177AS18_9BILA|nr:hypothetical protein A3Q56_08119 [Intoshia linei]